MHAMPDDSIWYWKISESIMHGFNGLRDGEISQFHAALQAECLPGFESLRMLIQEDAWHPVVPTMERNKYSEGRIVLGRG